MELFPAIDLRGATAVRLSRGDFDAESRYGDPVDLARRYEAAGARWIHVVDLDAARTGVAHDREQVLAVARAVAVPVQAGGGVRSAADVEELLGGGVARVVLGTVAVTHPALAEELVRRFAGRVAVGFDHRGGGREVAVDGWQRGGGASLSEALASVASWPLASVVVTAIERDGVLEGPDLAGLERVLADTAHPVVASGGVRSVEDLAALGRLQADGRRLAGVIVGRALVEGALDVEEAVAACAASG